MTEPLFPVEDVDPARFVNKFENAPETKYEQRKRMEQALLLQEEYVPYQHDVEEPNTSFLAAQSKKGKVGTELLAAYEILAGYPKGLTDFELAERLEVVLGRPIRPTSAGARRIALRDEYNLVEYAGFTRKTDSGNAAKVWKLKN